MVQWFVQSISNRNIAGSIPTEYRFTRLSSPLLSLGGYQQPKYGCLSMRGGKKERNCGWPKTATGSCVVQDQAPQQQWSIRSAWQPDRLCNSGTSTMLVHSRAIIAYGDGRSKVQGVGSKTTMSGQRQVGTSLSSDFYAFSNIISDGSRN